MDELLAEAEQQGLTVTQMRGSSLHWHLKKPGRKGTVEVTLIDGVWIVEVRANRSADWTDEAARNLRSTLARQRS